ncbi:hypothetical protein [Streptomyces sp. NPDC090026]|uniref:hypothetical protein n=1 Tax=Streptomyces sp. NPDC090026 TaxID=3365923 RepID=UPI00382B6502
MRIRLNRVAAAAGATAVLCAGSGILAPAAAADDTRKNRVLIVMLDFQDRTHANPGASKANYADRYFGAEDSLKSYYDHVSRGQIDFVPAVSEKVIGPFTLPMSGARCQARDIRKTTQALLEAKGFKNGEDYDSLSMVTPRIACRWSGLATLGGNVSWIQSPSGSTNQGVLVHEFGHNQGYPHQRGILCKDGNLTNCGKGKGLMSPDGQRQRPLRAQRHTTHPQRLAERVRAPAGQELRNVHPAAPLREAGRGARPGSPPRQGQGPP